MDKEKSKLQNKVVMVWSLKLDFSSSKNHVGLPSFDGFEENSQNWFAMNNTVWEWPWDYKSLIRKRGFISQTRDYANTYIIVLNQSFVYKQV